MKEKLWNFRKRKNPKFIGSKITKNIAFIWAFIAREISADLLRNKVDDDKFGQAKVCVLSTEIPGLLARSFEKTENPNP